MTNNDHDTDVAIEAYIKEKDTNDKFRHWF
jgi:hypothetical protein